jgi:undecaprenyl pyrophosphate synthase
MGFSQQLLKAPIALVAQIYSLLQSLLVSFVIQVLRAGPIPRHVAFIMDGNRRYADRSKIDRRSGHVSGYKSLMKTLEACLDLGVEVITVYAFSIDNFKRSPDEVRKVFHKLAIQVPYEPDMCTLDKDAFVKRDSNGCTELSW